MSQRFLLLCLLSWLLLAASVRAAAIPVTLYVSPVGSDRWSGRLPLGNRDGSDGPLATLEQARDLARKISKRSGVTIVVRGGDYSRSASLLLTHKDSGTREHPVVWKAADGEHVTLSGASTVYRFKPVTEPATLARLAPSAAKQVVVADLRAQGLTDYGTIEQRGSPGLELFYDGKRMPVARYPNDGWLHIADVPQDGPTRFNEGLEREKRFKDIPAGRHYGRITYAEDRPDHWAPDANIYAHGYWVWDWNDSFQRVASIDPIRHEITFAAPHHHYGYAQNQRYYFLNVLEELDQPGEWYLDRGAGLLYFYPPAKLESNEVQVSMLSGPFIQLDDVRHLNIEGISFTASRGAGIVLRKSSNCRVSGCAFSNLGDLGVEIDGGERDVVTSSDFNHLARGAVQVSGGDRRRLLPSHHQIVNNHIHHFSEWLRTGQYGISIDGVGQRIAQNLIHDAPFEALYLKGNDHVIELNEIHSVTQETGDAGALHTGRDWTWRGNVVRNNYWHHLHGPGVHGVTAVYLDDFSSGFTVTGNMFYRAGRAVQIGGGRDNLVSNNVFVECEPAVHIDARGLSWAANYFDGRFPWMFERFHEMKADRSPYSKRYPPLATLLRDQPALPKGNRIVNNISWGGRWLDVYDYQLFDFRGIVEMKDNVISDPRLWRRRAANAPVPEPYYLNIDTRDGYDLLLSSSADARQELSGNDISSTPPGTFNPATLAFVPRSGVRLPAGFKPIPVQQIGLQRDAWRHDVPPRFTGDAAAP